MRHVDTTSVSKGFWRGGPLGQKAWAIWLQSYPWHGKKTLNKFSVPLGQCCDAQAHLLIRALPLLLGLQEPRRDKVTVRVSHKLPQKRTVDSCGPPCPGRRQRLQEAHVMVSDHSLNMPQKGVSTGSCSYRIIKHLASLEGSANG